MDWNRDAPRLLHNDLEAAACDMCPDIQRAKKELVRQGASGALMSGSGSSVFGLFETDAAAHDAFSAISGSNRNWRVFVTRMLA